MQIHRNYFGEQLTPWESSNQNNNILFSATTYPIHRFSIASNCGNRVRKRSEQSKSIPIKFFKKNSITQNYSKTVTKLQTLYSNKQKNLHNLIVNLSPQKSPNKSKKNYTLNFFKRASKIQPNSRIQHAYSFVNKTKADEHKIQGKLMKQSYRNSKVRSHSVFI